MNNRHQSKKDLVVYTALFGDYDELLDPLQVSDDCDYVCFTNNNGLKSEIWKIINVSEFNTDHAMLNRKFKLLPHKFLMEYKSSLYIDSNIALVGNVSELFEKYLKVCDFALPKHFLRNCLYDEARVCKIQRKGIPKEINEQIDRYRYEGMPEYFGLSENNIILRNHNSVSVVNAMELWWNELSVGAKRDQLSLPYVMWKLKQKYHFMDETARSSNDYFIYNKHKSDKKTTAVNKIVTKMVFLLRSIYFSIF